MVRVQKSKNCESITFFGGKDRHSKVCTIRGLRDRRIRLSVPTAIQLYDLQDKLGLSQPSKVIDWLLEATKLDIDKLPPLQFPQGFSQFHHHHPQTLLPFHDSSASSELSLGPFYDANSTLLRDGGIQNLMEKSRFWDMDSLSRVKGKELAERGYNITDKGKWIKTNEQENQEGVVVGNANYNNLQKLFPMSTHHSPLPADHPHQSNGVQFPSSLNVPSSAGNSQLLFGPSSAATPSLFTPFMTENDPSQRQFNSHIHQFLNSSSGSSQLLPHPLIPSLHSFNSTAIRPFPSPFSSKLMDSDNNNRNSQPDKGSDARSRS
ncbi:hypothetical protein SESBI_09085 [Sesbania bispinosa]|nr:hypothetical protein SESBI_09085 [Sesbania bispinosa]